MLEFTYKRKYNSGGNNILRIRVHGKAVKKLRIDLKKLDIAQARCGKNLNDLPIPSETLRNVKRGKNVRPQTVYKFAQALGCDVTELLKEGDA